MKKIISYLFIIITVLSFIPEYKTSASYEYETPVVFIHGYNSSVNMWKDTGFYKEFGKVYLVDYRDLARNDITSTEVRKRIQKQLDFAINDSPNGQTDVVVHSMGGLAIRYFLSLDENKEYREKIRQIVFLATPNRGSKVAFSGRLADIIANPDVYGISKDKLSRYSEAYRKYKEFILSEYTEGKMPSFEDV